MSNSYFIKIIHILSIKAILDKNHNENKPKHIPIEVNSALLVLSLEVLIQANYTAESRRIKEKIIQTSYHFIL